ncbi:phage major capsid protein [Edaphobacillus lindanitolerans]|uniref:Phage prohead protease, HK97 family/phage major capsid protein, HK97 family,TIGR01554 n=1 Tax=Edaphobacillus lindanitolerans TaxID=550447 RepID=A0A1U7PMC7_9BACI|nr:phage major capsid protein [Edaphobacillus lindanitolerans]SIT90625.1 phage prohead protease, HK97 family/phage major capsid protein, HK97 family,TIGR01554 [Edaphobacillus lindanitolerans]
MKMELRSQKIELQSNGDMVVEGYVNKTNMLSNVLGTARKFREMVAPGAFASAIKAAQEIEFLAEHDRKQILSSTRNGSLHLEEDEQGLFMRATITPTTYGKDSYELIKSGIYQNMSFGFRAIKDSWKLVEGIAVRTIEQLELFEVSVVKNPAYSQTEISARGIELVKDVEVPDEILEFSDIINQNERGNQFMVQEMKIEKREMEASYEQELRNLATTTTGQAVVPEGVQGEIVKRMEETSPAFANARKIPSESGTLKVARENDTVTAGFFGEGEDILESTLGFTHVELKQKRLGAATSVSNMLINDAAVDIVAYTNDLLGRRVAKTAEKAIFKGNGTTEFTGIIGDAEVKVVEATAGVVSVDELMEMYTAIHPDFLNGAAFYFSRPFFNKIAKLKDNNGHFYLQNGVVNGKVVYTIFGVPVHVTDALDAGEAVDQTPVVFANMAEAYSIMVKKGMAIQQVTDTKTVLNGTQLLVLDGYMDGAVVNPQAVVKMEVKA